VTVSGISISGADAGNYTFNTTATATANITARVLVVSATADGKVYDGTTTAVAHLSDNRVGGDILTDSYTSATFADQNAGAGKTVTVSGITISGADAGNYTANTSATTTADITPATLTATGKNFAATAGAPFSGEVARFVNADPVGGPDSYTATITWGDGGTSAGTITDNGDGTFSVSGSHTYADPGSDTVQVLIQHKLGNTTAPTTTATATVTSLGLGIGAGQSASINFWQGSNGQALIISFNGGSSSTALANWLAAAFPNLYGANAGANNLTGKTNAQVAAFYLTLFALQGPKVDAEVLATALNVYATTQSLGGTAGQSYGFTISATGLGARSYNVGSSGAAFGVANNTTLNVYQLLQAANSQTVNGVLYNGDATLRQEANDVFDGINNAGGL
jgi:hypothetical protein